MRVLDGVAVPVKLGILLGVSEGSAVLEGVDVSVEVSNEVTVTLGIGVDVGESGRGGVSDATGLTDATGVSVATGVSLGVSLSAATAGWKMGPFTGSRTTFQPSRSREPLKSAGRVRLPSGLRNSAGDIKLSECRDVAAKPSEDNGVIMRATQINICGMPLGFPIAKARTFAKCKPF